MNTDHADIAVAAARGAFDAHVNVLEALGSSAFVTQWQLPDETIGIALVAPAAHSPYGVQAVLFIRQEGDIWDIEGWLESDDDRQIGPTVARRMAWHETTATAAELANRLANMLVGQFMTIQLPAATVITSIHPIRLSFPQRVSDWFVQKSRGAGPSREFVFRHVGVPASTPAAMEAGVAHYGVAIQDGLPLHGTLPAWMIVDGRAWSRARKTR